MGKIVYVVPGLGISGGIAVVFQHVNRLKKRGYDVAILNIGKKQEVNWFDVSVDIFHLNSCNKKNIPINNVEIVIATHFTTVDFVDEEISAKRKIYFVQSDERRFSEGYKNIKLCQNTYENKNFEYMTEAVWIQRWLKEEFGHNAYYVPNGLDDKIFYKTKPIKKRNKKRVLIEGPINIPFKGMEDAYRAISTLDCEIWIISSFGKPKKGWRYDQFFESVPMIQMREIYSSCDIFLKMSRVEGFFGPPLEAMGCGCAVVVSKCTGYDEYITNDENALVVEMSDVSGASNAVHKLLNDDKLMKRLVAEGKKTAKKWSWDRSIDLLEKVMSNDHIKIFYHEKFPERYNYNLVMKEVFEVAAEKCLVELQEKNIELEKNRSSKFWKIRGVYLNFKNKFLFVFKNPKKFIKKYL